MIETKVMINDDIIGKIIFIPFKKLYNISNSIYNMKSDFIYTNKITENNQISEEMKNIIDNYGDIKEKPISGIRLIVNPPGKEPGNYLELSLSTTDVLYIELQEENLDDQHKNTMNIVQSILKTLKEDNQCEKIFLLTDDLVTTINLTHEFISGYIDQYIDTNIFKITDRYFSLKYIFIDNIISEEGKVYKNSFKLPLYIQKFINEIGEKENEII